MWRFRNFPFFSIIISLKSVSRDSPFQTQWNSTEMITANSLVCTSKIFGICNYMCKHIDLITLLHQDYLEVWNTFETFTSGVLRRCKSFLHFFFTSPTSSQRSHFACRHRDPVTHLIYTSSISL